MRRSIRSLITALVVVGTLLAAGCSRGSDDAAMTEVHSVDSVRSSAAAAMADVDTVHFAVARSGAEVSIDDAGLVLFQSADGRYAAPGSADAVVAVSLLGSKVELGAVAIDGTLYLTDPLTGAWQDATGTIAFDPAKIFSPTEGIANVLSTGMLDASLASDTPDADGFLQLSGTVAATDVDTLTSGLVSEAATADVTIDASTFLVRTITFDTPIDEGVASWRVQLSDYGASVEIEAPDLGTS